MKMDTLKILEKLDACKNRAELETLWTQTWLAYRGEADKVLSPYFEKRRGEVEHTLPIVPECYKSYGWD
jgi:hypothetical protein